MRKLLAGLAGLLMLAWAGLFFIGIEPKDRRPGTRLSGEMVEIPTDWSFLDDVQEVHIETDPWWGVPFSVTVVIGRDSDALYSPSIYSEPGPFPGTKFWNRIIAQNPAVRLRVGQKLYAMDLIPAVDDAETDRGMRALAAKYPFWNTALNDPAKRPPMVILRHVPRT
jgi:hypothetical protein